MTRFIASLFTARTPAAPATAPRRSSLGVESLETRETPSGKIGHALSKISHPLHSHGLPYLPSTATLVTSFDLTAHR
jgi:hypothetical protein